MELSRGNGPGRCVVGQQLRKPHESTSTNCTYMAWPKNEITKVFGAEVLEPPPHTPRVEIMSASRNWPWGVKKMDKNLLGNDNSFIMGHFFIYQSL